VPVLELGWDGILTSEMEVYPDFLKVLIVLVNVSGGFTDSVIN
jgi:hypothetical protein